MANINPSNPQRRPGDFGGTSGRFGTETKEHAHDTASSVMDKGREMASSVAEKAKDAASSVSDKAQDLASSLGHKASDLAGEAKDAVTNAWDSSRDYVSEQGFSGIADDLTNLVRRNPVSSLCIGFCLGFFLARAIRD